MAAESGWAYQTSGSGVALSRDNSGDFTRLSQLISSNIQKIQQNVSQIQRLVAQLGTPQDSVQLRGKLHEQQHQTNDVAKDTNKMLKDLANLPHTPDQRQFKLQKDRLTNDLMTVLTNFQSIQRQAAQKEKASVIRARANSSIEGYSPFDEPPSEGSGPGLSSSQRLQIEQNLDLKAIQEREEAIQQLESDIVDVNQIFKDLALMVHEQGEVVDSIEANVDSAVINVQQGGTDIQRASRYQKSARKKKVICTILLVVAVIILILVIYYSLK